MPSRLLGRERLGTYTTRIKPAVNNGLKTNVQAGHVGNSTRNAQHDHGVDLAQARRQKHVWQHQCRTESCAHSLVPWHKIQLLEGQTRKAVYDFAILWRPGAQETSSPAPSQPAFPWHFTCPCNNGSGSSWQSILSDANTSSTPGHSHLTTHCRL